MTNKFQIYILVFLMMLVTIDFVYLYIQCGELELFYLGSMYLACGIGLSALKEFKNQSQE
jgi:hypothetical protein